MDGENQHIQINTYSKVWKVEHTMYSLGNRVLPVPICPYDLLYMVCSLLFIMFLCKAFPILYSIPSIIKYIAIPYGITTFMRKMKLDGKSPIRFFITYMRYLILEKTFYFERFSSFHDTERNYQVKWICSVRYHKH